MRRSILVLVLCLIAGGASAKSLYWRELNVDANLDRDGNLHVDETQQIVFDGDWNGGERRLRVSPGQSFTFEQLTRVGDDGREVRLADASLDGVDHYHLDGHLLRWRSRLPNDPPFESTAITYRLRYLLTGVVQETGGNTTINHDFAFPDRQGVIEHFHLHFTADPVWRGIESPLELDRRNVPPGQGVVVRRTLVYTGSGRPAAVTVGLSRAAATALTTLLLIGVTFLAFAFFTAEERRGRFRLTPSSAIDAQWLEENVFHLKPEVAGAALHGDTGAAEVAATLAALVQEKKIESTVEKHKLRHATLKMKLLVPLKEIEASRRPLIEQLFFDGPEVTTDALREHYRDSGFSPARTIRPAIDLDLDRLPGWSSKVKLVNWWLDAGLVVAAFVLFLLLARGDNDQTLFMVCLFFGIFSLVPSLVTAFLNANAVTRLPLRFALVGAFLLPLLGTATYYILAAPAFFFTVPALAGAIASVLAIVHIVLDALRATDSDERLALRLKLESARRYFLAQLAEREPHLHDDWYPWLIAFGLGRNVDSWFSARGSHAGFATPSSSFSSGSSSGDSSAGPTWTGGGGAFGGAGASASWATAATAFGSGVSAPGSGGGDGGGGGGGSSSGGGGGGGW